MKTLHTDIGFASVSDWYTLGAVIGVTPQLLAWTLKARDSMQHRIDLKGRTVYASEKPLKHVQIHIEAMLSGLLDSVQDNEVVLAYRQGVNPAVRLREYAGSERLISFDIRHYYDSVKLRQHIAPTLEDYGFTPAGARLVGRYCVVRRDTVKLQGDEGTVQRGGIQSLQQGCPASPVISNLVGYKFIDRPILDWLRGKWPNLKYKYVRYCDNAELFLQEETDKEFYNAYKEFVCKELRKNGFRTHDWASIGQHDRHRNIQFLGVVLNKVTRVEREKIDALRATLFNMATRQSLHDFYEECLRFHREYGTVESEDGMTVVRCLRALSGYVAYLTPINQKHAMWLRKLLALVKWLNEYSHYNNEAPQNWAQLVMSYKDNKEGVDSYLKRMQDARNAVCEDVGGLANA